jgi:hypothetical protein
MTLKEFFKEYAAVASHPITKTKEAKDAVKYLVTHHQEHKALKSEVRQAETELQKLKEQPDSQRAAALEKSLQQLKEKVKQWGQPKA